MVPSNILSRWGFIVTEYESKNFNLTNVLKLIKCIFRFVISSSGQNLKFMYFQESLSGNGVLYVHLLNKKV